MNKKNHKIKLSNGLTVMLDYDYFTAEIVKSKEARGDVIIPRIVEYNSKKFVIKSIGVYAFEYNHFIDSLTFEKDSEVQCIGKNAFYHCYVKSITLPAKYNNSDNEWIQNTVELKNIDYSPENQHFCKVNNSLLLYKKNITNSEFDILVFAPRNIRGKIIIPSNIRNIGPYSFNLCYKMTSLLIPPESSIQEISLYAFYKCYSLKNISSFPASCTKISRWCFAYSNHLTSIEFLGDEITLCVGCFSRCTSLSCISFPNVTRINVCEHVFDNVSGYFSLFTKINADIVKISENV